MHGLIIAYLTKFQSSILVMLPNQNPYLVCQLWFENSIVCLKKSKPAIQHISVIPRNIYLAMYYESPTIGIST